MSKSGTGAERRERLNALREAALHRPVSARRFSEGFSGRWSRRQWAHASLFATLGMLVAAIVPGLGPTDASTAPTQRLSMTLPLPLNTSPWDVAPAHMEFTLTGYQLQDKFHQPRIYIYPADEYVQLMPTVAEQFKRIKNILAGVQPTKNIMPSVPFFNAGALIASNMQFVMFQSGGGVRMLTEYAQYPATINNRDLFYHFEGLTRDGKYYVIAILPITAPILPEDEKPDAAIPPGGIPIPADSGPNYAYYATVTEKLNSISPDAFTPPLTVLDALIQSINVTTP